MISGAGVSKTLDSPAEVSLTEFAPAKINLHLHVVGRRDDGYHLLDSMVVFAGVGDRLTVTPASSLSLSVTGPFAAGLVQEADNLVRRAALALAEYAGIKPGGTLVLEKNLPVASGIGGGSADAAAALRLLSRVWGLDLDRETLGRIGRRLGADLPVCVGSRPAMMSGIGESLAPAPKLPPCLGIVLVNPGMEVSTPQVFRSRAPGFSAPAVFPEAGWRDVGGFVGSLQAGRNDLEAAARGLAPVIGEVLEALAATAGCLLSRMSGSGATCFGLFDTPAAAAFAAPRLACTGWWVWGGGLATE